jgi:multiple sugar transport system permease protein
MATTTLSTPRAEATVKELAARNRNTKLQEGLLGLLFVTPVAVITLLFEIFPVIYGFYISLQDQKGVLPDGFVGMRNFVLAAGSFAYLLPLVVATVLITSGNGLYRQAMTLSAEGKGAFRPYLIPGFVVGVATIAFTIILFRYGLDQTLVPLIVLIAGIIGYWAMGSALKTDSTMRARYMLNSWGVGGMVVAAILLVLFSFTELESALTPILSVLPQYVKDAAFVPLAPQFFVFGGAMACIAAILFINARRERLDPDEKLGELSRLGFLRTFLILFAFLFLLYGLVTNGALYEAVAQFKAIPSDQLRARTAEIRDQLTVDQRLAFTASRQAETAIRMTAWIEVYTMLLGIGFIAFAYYLWDGAKRRETTPGMLLTIFVALCLMIGGYFFIGELPNALASGDRAYYDSLIRTVTYAILTVPVQLALGLALAYLLFHEVRQGKAIFRLIFFMPYIAPTVATAAVFSTVFSSSPISLANQFMQSLGLPNQEWLQTQRGLFELIAQQINPNAKLPNFLIGPSLPLLSAILYSIWVFSGYNAVVFMAGLGNVPKEVYEAAQVDGAGRWTTFRRIVFPLISPTTYFLSLLAIIGTFRAFTHIWVLRADSRGSIDTAMIYIYNVIREQSSGVALKTQSYAAALSFLLFGIILILTIVQNRYSRDRVFYG